MPFLLSLLVLLLSTTPAWALVRTVGPGKTYATPCAAAAAAVSGDTIEIDPIEYLNDSCVWPQDNLTWRTPVGAVGYAWMHNTSGDAVQHKGTWVITGAGTMLFQDLEFSHQAVPDGNGSGLRFETPPTAVTSITVNRCFFHDAQDGILSGLGGVDYPNTDFFITNSNFWHNGIDSNTHNIYIANWVKSFTFKYSSSKGANGGQDVKTRAKKTFILYSTIGDFTGGNTNYEIDISEGGEAYVIGNTIYQAATTSNPVMLTFNPEGTLLSDPTPDFRPHPIQKLYVINNTFVSDRAGAQFIRIHTSPDVPFQERVIQNNAFVGPTGVALTIEGVTQATPSNNLPISDITIAGFVDYLHQNYRLLSTSILKDFPSSVAPGTFNGNSLDPVFQYTDPLLGTARTVVGSFRDMGAFEYPIAGGTGISAPFLLGSLNNLGQAVLTWSTGVSDGSVINGYQVLRNGTLLATITTPTFTYTDSTMVAATTYVYTLKATNVAAQTSSSSNAVTLIAPANCSIPLPTTVGWCKVPNTKVSSVCAPVNGTAFCSPIFYQPGGGVMDQGSNRLFLGGGGLTDSQFRGNEWYVFDLNLDTLVRFNQPDVPQNNSEFSVGGTRPNARWRYNGMAFMSALGKIFMFGGGSIGSSGPTTSLATWLYTPATNLWELKTPTGTAPASYFTATAYNPGDGKVYIDDGACLRAYNPNTGTQGNYELPHSPCQASPSSGTNYNHTMIVDSVAQRLYLIGGGVASWVDLASGSDYAKHDFSTATGCAALINAKRPGLGYLPSQHGVVGWPGGDSVVVLNATATACTTITNLGGPGDAQFNGTFGRFACSPTSDRCVLANQDTQDTFVLNLTPGGSGGSGGGVEPTFFGKLILKGKILLSGGTLPPPPFLFDFTISAPSVTTTQGASTTNTFTMELFSGTPQLTTLVASGLPANATSSFSLNQGLPGFVSTLTLTAASTTPVGTSTITVTSTGGPVIRVHTFDWIVTAAVTPPSGLGAFWKFDEGSGTTAADSTGNGNTLTLANGAAWSASPTALLLDGINDIAYTTTFSYLLNGDLTYTAWINWNGVGGASSSYIIGTDNPLVLFFDKANTRICAADFAATTIVCSANGTISPNAWTFVGVTRSGTGPQAINVWVNGTKTVGSLTNAPSPGSPHVGIGNKPDLGCAGIPCGTLNPFGGQIRYVRIDPNAISDATMIGRSTEIATVATVALPTFTPSGGTFPLTSSPLSVTIATATAGATIYYTTNGTIPTISSTVYTAPISVSVNTTIEALAVKAGLNNSQVAVTAISFSIAPSVDSGVSDAPTTPTNTRIFIVNPSVSGDPAGNGEWQHFESAMVTMAPGDTYQLKPGFYHCRAAGLCTAGLRTPWLHSGTKALPVTIQPYPTNAPWAAVFDEGFEVNAAWIIIEGLKHINGSGNGEGINFRLNSPPFQNASHVTLRNNWFYHVSGSGIFASGVNEFLIEDNIFEGSGIGPPTCGATNNFQGGNVGPSRLYIHCHGAYLDNSNGSVTLPGLANNYTIRRNKFLGNTGGAWNSRADAFPDALPVPLGHRDQGWLVENNLIVNHIANNIILDIDNSIIRNNTMVIFDHARPFADQETCYYINHIKSNIIANNICYIPLDPNVDTIWPIHSWGSDSTIGNTWSHNAFFVRATGMPITWGGITLGETLTNYRAITGDTSGLQLPITTGTGSEAGFVNALPSGTPASALVGDYHLTGGSPLRNTGDVANCAHDDITGAVRTGGTCDIGAYGH